jgi:hypothetical protein
MRAAMRSHLLIVLLAACGAPAVGETRMGLRHTGRPANCSLQLVSIQAGDMAPGARFGSGGELEMVGMVTIGADAGTDPFSEPMKQIVRPRACAMGGEVVSLLASGSDSNAYGRPQQSIAYTVWARRATAPTGPQAF